MDVFLGKLTHLAYEFFGLLLPGVLASVFLVLTWIALGSLVPIWSSQSLPAFSPELLTKVERLSTVKAGVLTFGIVVASYFLGHIILWPSRRKPKPEVGEEWLPRIWAFLRWRVPKTEPYDPALEPLFKTAAERLSTDLRALHWRQFYPVGRVVVWQKLKHSLISHYQNKYSVHRSLAVAAAGWFWLSSATLIGASGHRVLCGTAEPRWALLIALPVVSILLVWRFSASYRQFYRLWGDTVITEAYCALLPILDSRSQQDADGKDETS